MKRSAHDLLHVAIGREEDDHAVGHTCGELYDESPIVVDDRSVAPALVARVERHLVGAAGDDHGADALAGERHLEGLGERHEVEDLGVEVDGAEGA
eukprot:768216-Hanusia_phi.AAC.4